MFIIFGWEKKGEVFGEIGSAFCFDCRRKSQWVVWSESEWVTFSALRVFRFIHKHHLQCGGCTAVFPLNSSEFREIELHMKQHESVEGTAIHASLAKRIEAEQLARKTPLQLKFIRETMKAQDEYRARIQAQDELIGDKSPQATRADAASER